MGRKQQALDLDRLPLSNRGKTAEVFQTGQPYHSGHVEHDPGELPGIKEGLGVRSALVVPLKVEGTRRGALQVDAVQPEQFTEEDLAFRPWPIGPGCCCTGRNWSSAWRMMRRSRPAEHRDRTHHDAHT